MLVRSVSVRPKNSQGYPERKRKTFINDTKNEEENECQI